MPRRASKMQPVAKSDWFNLRASADKTNAEVDLIGTVGAKDWDGEGVTVSGFLASLRSVGEEVSSITLNIHSPGGLITEGLMMYNALQMSGATIKARIMGLCGSMATVIACAADEIEMPENAVWHIHEVQGGAFGSASDLERASAEADFYQQMIAKIYAERTGKSVEDCIALMKQDLPMDGPTAKEHGFVDTVTDAVALSACVKFPGVKLPAASLAKLPPEARSFFDSAPLSPPPANTGTQAHPHPMTEAELKAAQAKLEADQKALAEKETAMKAEKATVEQLKAEADKLKLEASKKLKAAKKLRAESDKDEDEDAKNEDDEDEEENEDDEDGDEDGKDKDGDGDGDGKAALTKLITAQLKPLKNRLAAAEKENANLKATLKDPKLLAAFTGSQTPTPPVPPVPPTNEKPNPLRLLATGIAAAQQVTR